MSDLVYKDEVFKLVGLCMEVHRELGRGQEEVIYKDAFVVELQRAQIPYAREKIYTVTYKGVILPHHFYADFVIWEKIVFEAKAVDHLNDSHIRQVVNYLSVSNLQLGLLVNFGSESLEWKRFVRSTRMHSNRSPESQLPNSRQLA